MSEVGGNGYECLLYCENVTFSLISRLKNALRQFLRTHIHISKGERARIISLLEIYIYLKIPRGLKAYLIAGNRTYYFR